MLASGLGTNLNVQLQVYDVMPTLLSLFGVSKLCTPVPVPHCTRFLKSLHAHVQVRTADLAL